ncbi:MAG: hypothetical protein Q4Q03_06745, partial [Bowdeniella nasicola]|nr:hypothetical protein [Bowdeniella nasicola]
MEEKPTEWDWEFTPQVHPLANQNPPPVPQPDPPVPGEPSPDARPAAASPLPGNQPGTGAYPPAGGQMVNNQLPTSEYGPAANQGAPGHLPPSAQVAPGQTPSQFSQFAPAGPQGNYGGFTQYAPRTASDYQPGIMPFRPLRFGEFFDCSFRALRFNPQVLFGYSAILMAISVLPYFAFRASLQQLLVDPDAVLSDETALAMLWQSAVQGLMFTVITGFLVFVVVGAIQGRRISFGAVWDAMKGKVLRLLGLITLITAVSIVSFVGVFAAGGFILYNVPDAALGSFIFIGVVAAMIAVAIFALTMYSALAVPVLVVEDLGVFRSIARSFRLLKGYFWRTVLMLFLGSSIVGAVSGVITTLLVPLATGLLSAAGLFSNI